MELRRATRQKAKLRIGISAPSGFGKTYSALLIAYGITGDWEKIAIIDTENGSGELYSHLGDYNALPLEAPYSPERYIQAIHACEAAGMEVVIIDSISHEWEGKGGCLEIQESLGGRYQDWAKVTPRHQAFIGAILSSKCHIITTVRRKQDYDMVKEGNSTKVVKAGLKEVTREGFEYELTLNLEIVNDKHLAKASKDRTGLFVDKPEQILTVESGKQLKEWADTGVSVLDIALQEVAKCESKAAVVEVYARYPNLKEDESFKAALSEKRDSFVKPAPEPDAQTEASLQVLEDVAAKMDAEKDKSDHAPINADQQKRLLKVLDNACFTQKEKDDVVASIINMSTEAAETEIVRLTDEVIKRKAVPEEETEQPNIKYASNVQKEKIIRLLNNPVITRQEKTKMLLNINKLDGKRASEAIDKLNQIIEEREDGQATAA